MSENKGDCPFASLTPYKEKLFLEIIKAESRFQDVSPSAERLELLQLLKEFSDQILGLNVGLIDEEMASVIVQTNYKLSVSAENIDGAALDVFKRNPERRFSVWAGQREFFSSAFSHIENEICMKMEEEGLDQKRGLP